MAQLQRMDSCLNTLSTELYQVNVCVGRIAWRQVSMGDFASEATPSPPSLVASDSEDEDDANGDDDDTSDDADGDASSTDEMSTLHSYPLSFVTKKGSSFGKRVVHLRGRVSIGSFC